MSLKRKKVVENNRVVKRALHARFPTLRSSYFAVDSLLNLRSDIPRNFV